MKRTNLVLDEQLLDEATRELGMKTYSAAINYALKEVLRMRKVEGNLSRMREAHPARRTRSRRQFWWTHRSGSS
ncbi:MAG: type II toxin-antitoxin system VapB family antitoxin [Bryobacteraceae bacterium]|jgi:Arc/MetJ family transcription regulator